MRTSKGFGLIEILVAIFIVSFGVLAVGKLQTTLISTSNDNKIRAKMVALAESEIESFRNQAKEIGFIKDESLFLSSDQGGFFDFSGLADGGGSNTTVYYDIARNVVFGSDNADFSVSISWKDSAGDDQYVALSTTMTFLNPSASASGLCITDCETTYVDAPTGRARIGDGELSDADKAGAYSSEDDDGTRKYNDADSNDRLLAVGDDVVLTLEEACVVTGDPNAEVDCTDFVEISGRVYFDDAFDATTKASEVFLLASDAAYCARYYGSGDSAVSFEEKINAGSSLVKPTINITSLPRDVTNKYHYFEYTCYIGGGWHGNIGIVFGSNVSVSNNEAVCVGDPNSSVDTVEESRRRAYRGMVFKFESDFTENPDSYGVPTLPLDPVTYNESDSQTFPTDSELANEIRYYSWGIADATNIFSNGVVNNDFLITSLTGNNTCATVMDSAVFLNNADDFYCFNNVVNGATGISYDLTNEVYDYEGRYPTVRTHLDERGFDPNRDGEYENPGHYGFEDYCPYDPTNPPYFVYVASGLLTVNDVPENVSVSSIQPIYFQTTQGENCKFSPEITYGSLPTNKIYFECTLYDSGVVASNGKLQKAGFNGEIFVEDASSTDEVSISCSTDKITLTNIKDDVTGQNSLECSFSFDLVAGSISIDANKGDILTIDLESDASTNDYVLNSILPSDLQGYTVSIDGDLASYIEFSNGKFTLDMSKTGADLLATGSYVSTYLITDTDGNAPEYPSSSGTISVNYTNPSILLIDPSVDIFVNCFSSQCTISHTELFSYVSGGVGNKTISYICYVPGGCVGESTGINNNVSLGEALIDVSTLLNDTDPQGFAQLDLEFTVMDDSNENYSFEFIANYFPLNQLNFNATTTANLDVTFSTVSDAGEYDNCGGVTSCFVYEDSDGWNGTIMINLPGGGVFCSVPTALDAGGTTVVGSASLQGVDTYILTVLNVKSNVNFEVFAASNNGGCNQL